MTEWKSACNKREMGKMQKSLYHELVVLLTLFRISQALCVLYYKNYYNCKYTFIYNYKILYLL